MTRPNASAGTRKKGRKPAEHKWLENIGLILIILLILIFTITRYLHNIHWSIR